MPPDERPDEPPDTGRLNRNRLLLRALACALLALAVLRPPETYAWWEGACRVVLAAAGCLAWLRADGLSLLPAWTAGLLPLALAAVATASCRARALDEAGAALTLIPPVLLGRALAPDRRARDMGAGPFLGLGSVAALLAVLQHPLTYPEELRGLLPPPAPAAPYVL